MQKFVYLLIFRKYHVLVTMLLQRLFIYSQFKLIQLQELYYNDVTRFVIFLLFDSVQALANLMVRRKHETTENKFSDMS